MDPENLEYDQLSTTNTASVDDSIRPNKESKAPVSDDGSEELQHPTLFIAKDYQKAKWQRLSKDYNEQYLDVFRQSQQIGAIDEPLLLSQIGSVIWTTLEKERFFDALQRKGRHDVPAIAAAVGSKSEIEVTQLLLRLKDADVARQKFSQYAKHVTHADIDAAIEVDQSLETLLEEAADALAALQDYYDMSAVKKDSEEAWLIDSSAAAYIERKRGATEDGDSGADLEVTFTLEKAKNDALGMFKLDTLLELSKNVFMNTARHTGLDHWTEVAEDDEQPSMTVDAICTFYNLVKSISQRVVQSAIFLAESRMRSTTTPDYVPARVLKDIDVVAALNVLNMPVNSFEHWAKFPRRSGVRVVLGAHDKGHSDAEGLSLQKVENALAVRASRGRRRSLSSMVSMSLQGEDADDKDLTGDEHDVEASQSSPHSQPGDWWDRLPSGDTQRETTSSDDAPKDPTFEYGDRSSTDSDSYANSSDDGLAEVEGNTAHVSRKRRRHMQEEAQDEFLEKLDRAAKVNEAVRLRGLLGLRDAVEDREEELGKRPKTMRRTVDELRDWSDITYRSVWERKRSAQTAFGSSLDEAT